MDERRPDDDTDSLEEQARKARRDAERRLGSILDTASEYAFIFTDSDRHIVGWSKGAETLFRLTRRDVIGTAIDRLFTPEDRAAGRPEYEVSVAAAEGFSSDNRWHLRGDGTRVYVRGSVHPLPRDPDGRERGFIKIVRDETQALAQAEGLRALNEELEARVEQRSRELMAAEEALRQSQKMEAIGQLTGGVAHDFNNLLTVIRSSADLLRRGQLTPERQRRYVDAISDTADRAAKLTGQLLAFARRQALKPEVFNAVDCLHGIADMLKTVLGERVELTIEVDCEGCFIDADRAQFETAIVNMAVNGRDAMDGEGKLTVRLAGRPDVPAVRGHSSAPGDFVAVTVIDTGRGIRDDDLPRVFEPFFTTKDVGKGTGLGLSQVYGFAKQSGGEIDVESTPGDGARFTLFLPRAAAPAAKDGGQEEAGPLATPMGRLLVVEDNADVGEFATQLLRDLGYRTVLACHAAAALETLEHEGGFDLVFSDVVMPGMGGVELARRIRERWPGLPVVLTSGYSHVLAQDGHHGFPLLHKPYSVEDLQRTLAEAQQAGGRT